VLHGLAISRVHEFDDLGPATPYPSLGGSSSDLRRRLLLPSSSTATYLKRATRTPAAFQG